MSEFSPSYHQTLDSIREAAIEQPNRSKQNEHQKIVPFHQRQDTERDHVHFSHTW